MLSKLGLAYGRPVLAYPTFLVRAPCKLFLINLGLSRNYILLVITQLRQVLQITNYIGALAYCYEPGNSRSRPIALVDLTAQARHFRKYNP